MGAAAPIEELPFGRVLFAGRAESRQIGGGEGEQRFLCQAAGDLRAELDRLAAGTQEDAFAVPDAGDVEHLDGGFFGEGVGVARAEVDDTLDLRLHDLIDAGVVVSQPGAPAAGFKVYVPFSVIVVQVAVFSAYQVGVGDVVTL